jgi:DnaJ-class molecular chaperone
VTTVEGESPVEVSAGTQPNTQLRLKGKGVPRLGQPQIRGDQVLKVSLRFLVIRSEGCPPSLWLVLALRHQSDHHNEPQLIFLR